MGTLASPDVRAFTTEAYLPPVDAKPAGFKPLPDIDPSGIDDQVFPAVARGARCLLQQ